MGNKKHNKKQDYSKREEEKANRLIKYLCVALSNHSIFRLDTHVP